MIEIVIANIMNFFAGCTSIISTQGKNKEQIVFIEFIGSLFRLIMNILVRCWSDVIAKVIKGVAQILCIENKINKRHFIFISSLYICLCLIVTYLSRDLRCIISIIPTIIEFHALLVPSTKNYRWYIVITKIFWTINNLIFQLYIGIIFDIITVTGHLLKINNNQGENKKI